MILTTMGWANGLAGSGPIRVPQFVFLEPNGSINNPKNATLSFDKLLFWHFIMGELYNY